MDPLPEMPRGRPPQPVPSPAMGGGRGISTLSPNLQFEGNISGSGDLQIEGHVKGDVRIGRLIVDETGVVEGAVTAEYIEVRGRVVGAVSGKQVKLVGTAYVDGDISSEQLSIDVGAYFQGRCIQSRREAPAPAPAARPVPTPTPATTARPEPSTAGSGATPPHGDERPAVTSAKVN